jgi:TetR/AcrR family transcriptional regulator, cholesterol catabolism regulator
MSKDQILEAAAQIFRSKGFHAASMADIAEAVNLQKASLYHHVSSKQEILLELLDRALDVITEQVLTAVNKPGPADERLRWAVAAYLTTLIENRDLSAVLLLEHRSLEPAYQARHIPRRDRFEHIWRELLQDGNQEGVFKISDPALATRAILGALNWTITWFRPDGSLSLETMAQEYVNLFLGGLYSGGLYREHGHE